MTKKVPAVPRFMAAAACLLLIVWLSLKAVPVQFMNFYGWVKVNHAVAYGCLTFLIGWALEALHLRPGRRWLIAILAAMFVGCLMEILQLLLTATRRARYGDIVADFIGGLLVLLIVKIVGYD